MRPAPHIAVVGGGWAGIAAAVQARDLGARVTVLEMAPQLGGRARSLSHGEADRLDNGQHILIGAYTDTLQLMQRVGAAPEVTLLRSPLHLCYPDHDGLRLPAGHPLLAFCRGVLAYQHWRWRDRWACLIQATGWLLRGFRCTPGLSVAQLCARLPSAVRQELIDPLCVAALNTAATDASANVFLRVLKDALFSGPGSSDLLLPRRPLAELLPEPAARWLQTHGVELRLGHRVQSMSMMPQGFSLDGLAFDAVILACSAIEAGRLCASIAPAWSAQATGIGYEPIVTVYLHAPSLRLKAPMMALREDAQSPAQFAFDLGQLGLAKDRLALVCSGARAWVERGLDETAQAALRQAQTALGLHDVTLEKVLAEKRATFACTPGLKRPAADVTSGHTAGLWAAGDYIDGPYPATLEGAVRSGRHAALQAMQQFSRGA